jgi:hypothetical protein
LQGTLLGKILGGGGGGGGGDDGDHDGAGDHGCGGYDVHFVLSSLQLQHVNIRRQQQAQTAVQKGHQAVLIGDVQLP